MNKDRLVFWLFGAVVGLATGIHPLLADDWPQRRDAARTAVIFDTDMDTDCDDAGALAMLHAMADAGEAEILATMVSSRHKWSVPCVAAINGYYGRGSLPIGCPKGPGAPDLGSRYARQIAEEFPTRLKSNADAPEAVRLYRKILAARHDREVVVVTVGDLTNLRDLLATGPDEHSPLTGRELVRRKVKGWVCMGGRYPQHLDPKVYGNFKPDPASTVEAVANWPTTIYFTGLGEDLLTGEPLRQTPPGNPVRRAYELYLGSKPTRPSWDQVATLFAVRGCEPFFQLHRKGHNHIFANGTNQWRETPDKDHVLIQLAPGMGDRLRKTIDDLMARAPKASAGKSRSPAEPADPACGALAGNRYRVIVSTDIGGSDPDDFQSMVHYLLYADLFDTEGLIASPPNPKGTKKDILAVVDAYEKDYPSLKRRAGKYPTPAALRAVTKQGAIDPAPRQGFCRPTEGSRWIVQRAKAADPRPLYVLVWGSITDVAQAVHDAPEIKNKIRVYSIGSWNTKQDPHARDYVFQHHPDLWLIESNTTFRGMYMGGKQEGDLGNTAFVREHVKGHGALGEFFVQKKADIKMGDTPSVLYLLRGDPDRPESPHWGGQFVKTDHGPHYWTDDPSPQNIDAGRPGAWTVNRWREQYLRDWQERLDWTLPQE